jgi:hypothetical protein
LNGGASGPFPQPPLAIPSASTNACLIISGSFLMTNRERAMSVARSPPR